MNAALLKEARDYAALASSDKARAIIIRLADRLAALEASAAPLDDGGAQQSPPSLPPQSIRPKESPPPTRPEEPTIHTENDHAL